MRNAERGKKPPFHFPHPGFLVLPRPLLEVRRLLEQRSALGDPVGDPVDQAVEGNGGGAEESGGAARVAEQRIGRLASDDVRRTLEAAAEALRGLTDRDDLETREV